MISVQVLAEVCHVASRKAKLSWPEIEDVVDVVTALCDIVPLTVEIQHQARRLAARTSYTIYERRSSRRPQPPTARLSGAGIFSMGIS